MVDLAQIILAQSYSRTEALRRLRLIRLVVEKRLFNSEAVIETNPFDEEFMQSLKAEFYQKFNQENLEAKFLEAEEELRTEAALIIYLPVELPVRLQQEVGKRVREMWPGVQLVDWKLDVGLIAGAALVWKGKYRDYSIRPKLEKIKAEWTEQNYGRNSQ